jgi:tripartite-type tricarboxylate transporter receptor subunit TctC
MKKYFYYLKAFTVIGLVASSLLASPWALAQKYPDRPIKIVVPYPAGAVGDIMMRMIGQRLTERLGQPVIIDNRSGGGGLAATEAVAKSAPDGYTLLFNGPNHVTNLALYSKVPYDPILDFDPIIGVASTQLVLVAHKSTGIKSVQQLIEMAKAKPGELNYASSGAGTGTHLAMEMFMRGTDTKLTHIPYKGASPAVVGQASGQVQVSFSSIPVVLNFIKDGTLTPLLVGGDQKIASLPSVPNYKDLNLMNYDVEVWFGLFAPKNTPLAIRNLLYDEIKKYLSEPAVINKFSEAGLTIIGSNPAQFSEFVKAELKRWPPAIREMGIKPD